MYIYIFFLSFSSFQHTLFFLPLLGCSVVELLGRVKTPHPISLTHCGNKVMRKNNYCVSVAPYNIMLFMGRTSKFHFDYVVYLVFSSSLSYTINSLSMLLLSSLPLHFFISDYAILHYFPYITQLINLIHGWQANVEI